ncbi:MAG: CCA tRNA nucleotidyltransferase [Oscillospiraceae bacterium]
MPYILPNKAEYIICTLASANIKAYLVGGAVRAMLQNKPAEDLDFAVEAQTCDIMRVFPNAAQIGGEYGTVSVDGCELTPCRSEGGYTDHRHPSDIAFGTDIYTDLSRRDFTVNAMAYNGKELIDPYGGAKDLAEGILRCVGSPNERFNEDALRILRLFRFAAVHGFTVECDTFAAALENAKTVATLPKERVRQEVQKILLSDNPTAIGPLLSAGALSKYGIGSAKACVSALCKLPCTMTSRWWGLLYLTGANISEVCDKMGFSAAFMRDLALISEVCAARAPKDMHELKILLAAHCLIDEYEALHAVSAMNESFAEVPAIYEQLLNSNEPYLRRHLAIGGAQLVAMGIKGAKIKSALWELQMAVIGTPSLNTPKTLLSLVKSTKKWL